MNNQLRWKSKPAILATVTLIVYVANTLLSGETLDPNHLTELAVQAIGAIILLIGIWNNPKDKINF
jgi:uncharacterized membrane protein